MTLGISGSTTEKELSKLKSSRADALAISSEEYAGRLRQVRATMKSAHIDALCLDAASTSLCYFTGLL